MMDQKRLLWYTWFFSRGSPTLLVRAMQLIDDRLLEQGRQPVLFIEEKLAYMREMYRGKIPLGTSVTLLVRLDLLPDELGPPS